MIECAICFTESHSVMDSGILTRKIDFVKNLSLSKLVAHPSSKQMSGC